ncbi:TetR family transcriptional regulator [Mycobacterium sp. 663a-19]|uniref:TetR family transcriptional regulator n=1 Tax=Mycobacterium sp. 663a-19 TaxID=2986148 RepID=UPI002D1E54FC|nr:TetR family transcriptional regulator [Mycobacterium sp. 663a-19]MEB3980064.1 TetR family transcriptional regulator [Mycobacterium sp. 663a-19]
MPKGDRVVAQALRAARTRRGLSVRELARRVERSPSVISQIETGLAAPSAALLIAIARELDIDPDDLNSTPKRAAKWAGRPAKPKPRTPRAERADARRNRESLLEAASVLFAERGLKVSVAEIAERANVTVATLFRHFPSKRDLIEAISRERVKAVEDLVKRALANDDIAEPLIQAFEDILAMQARDRGLVQLIEAAISAELHAELIGAWAELLQRAQRGGVVRNDITKEDIPFLLASSGGVARVLGDLGPNLRRRYARLLVDSLRPGNETPLESEPPSIQDIVTAFGGALLDAS